MDRLCWLPWVLMLFAGVQGMMVRLQDGPTSHSGRVEVLMSGEWGTVCGRLWTATDASVVCRELRFGSVGRAVRHAAFGGVSDTMPIHMSHVGCYGNESSILNCPRRGGGACDHEEDAGVLCETDEELTQTGGVRLSGWHTNTSGRVEIQYYDVWGTVCWEKWGQAESQVACKDLGYCGGSPVKHSSSYFGNGTGPVWLTDVTCEGHEDELQQCHHSGWGDNECEHYTDVGVVCEMCATGNLRLYGSQDNSSGIVAISNNGVWGTICSDGWSDTEARVACQQLGFLDGLAVSNKNFSSAAGPVWMSGVSCTGWETQLTGCSWDQGWGVNNCRHYQDVAVQCLMTPAPTTRGSTAVTSQTTLTQTTTTHQPPDDKKDNNTLIIIGVVVGAVIVIVIVISVVYSVIKIKTTRKHSILVTRRGQQNHYAIDDADGGACALSVLVGPNNTAKCRGSGVYQEISDRDCAASNSSIPNRGRNSYVTGPAFDPKSRLDKSFEPLPEIPDAKSEIGQNYINESCDANSDVDHHYAAIPDDSTDHYLTPLQLKI